MYLLDGRTTRCDAGVVDVVVLAPVSRAKDATARSGLRAENRWRVLTLRRAPAVRCAGAWELVHGRIEHGEKPADAARREVREETGLDVQRLYSIAVNPFYLHQTDTVQLALVFAAIVAPASIVVRGPEHDDCAWRTPSAARRVLAWPREHQAIRYTMHLLRSGDAGAAEDVLLVP